MHNNNSFALALFNTIFKQTIRKQMNKKTRSYQKNVRIRFAFAPCVNGYANEIMDLSEIHFLNTHHYLFRFF